MEKIKEDNIYAADLDWMIRQGIDLYPHKFFILEMIVEKQRINVTEEIF